MTRTTLQPSRRQAPRRPGGTTEAAPGWRRFCGWCGGTWPVATDGRNLKMLALRVLNRKHP